MEIENCDLSRQNNRDKFCYLFFVTWFFRFIRVRGLLILISKDRKVSEPEIILMKRIGKALGLEKDFCDNAIREILNNKHILTEPPKFSTNELAKKFIKDGLTLADSDNEIHALEEAWLKSTAEKNGIDVEWFLREVENAAGRRREHDAHLEVDGLPVEYSSRPSGSLRSPKFS